MEFPPLSHFQFKYEAPLVLKTLYTQWMIEEGFLATTAYYASYAHTRSVGRKYLNTDDKVFKKIKEAIETNHPERLLKGSVCHSRFSRLT